MTTTTDIASSAQSATNGDEACFRALAESAPDAIIIETKEGTVYANQCATRLTGYEVDELQTRPLFDLLAPKSRARIQGLSHRHLSAESAPNAYEAEVLTKDGREVPVEVSSSQMSWKGQPATISFLRNISARRDVELELRQNRDMLIHGQSMAKLGSWSLDYATMRMTCSDEFYRIHGLAPDTPGMDAASLIAERVHPDDQEYVRQVTASVQNNPNPRPAEFRIIVDGEIRVLYAMACAIFDADGSTIVGTTGTVQDVTERRALEKELVSVRRGVQQQIGSDLHDTLGQELAGIAFVASALERKVRAETPALSKDAAQLALLTREALQRARRIAHGLVPVVPSADGLGSSLSELCDNYADIYDVSCRCEVLPPGLVYDNEVATHLYHIAGEAVNNAIRHGRATSIQVKLQTEATPTLTVSDNGEWLQHDDDGQEGMGLRVIKYRAVLIRGEFEIHHDSQGTTVAVTFRNPRPEVSG